MIVEIFKPSGDFLREIECDSFFRRRENTHITLIKGDLCAGNAEVVAVIPDTFAAIQKAEITERPAYAAGIINTKGADNITKDEEVIKKRAVI